MTTKHKAYLLADELEDANTDPWKAEAWLSSRIKEAVTVLRQQDAQIKLLESVLIKTKELLEQGAEVDFDDMVYKEILLEDACDIQELIEKTLDKEKDNEDE